MKKLIEDIRTAGKVFGDLRRARSEGFTPGPVQRTYQVPAVRLKPWGFTLEACLLYGPEARPVIQVFEALPRELQHALTFTPSDSVPGSWTDRARFWALVLRPALPPEDCRAVLLTLLRHYAWCVRRRRELPPQMPPVPAKALANSIAASLIVQRALLELTQA